MTSARMLLAIAMSAAAGIAHAELYKWTGPDGKTVYSDRPPTGAVAAQKPRLPGAASDSVPLPYELSQAAANHPVVLYTTANCAPCDSARKLLRERGIPFTEKTVTTAEDGARLQKVAGGDGQLPVLTIGRAVQSGFESGAWQTALTSAGYPQSNRLPRNYVHPPAQPLAPPVAKADSDIPRTGKEEADTGRAGVRPASAPGEAPARQPGSFQF